MGCFHNVSSFLILRLIGSTPPESFRKDEWHIKLLLVCTVVLASLESNFSLSLNSLSTYQLFNAHSSCCRLQFLQLLKLFVAFAYCHTRA